MSRLLNPTHPNPLILLLRSCLPDWSSDRYFFSLVQPSTLAQQLFATAGTSLELSLLLRQLIVSIVSATVSTTVHKKMFVLMRLVCCSDATVWWDFFPSSGWFHFQPCPWCSLDSFWPWLLHNHFTIWSLLTVTTEAVKEPLIFGRLNVQGEGNRGALGMRGAAITAQAHQRIPEQMSLNKMAARSAQSITSVIRTGWCLRGITSVNQTLWFLTQWAVVFYWSLNLFRAFLIR